jgi:TfoX/Sxy family transcriptional regulator of competence genes
MKNSYAAVVAKFEKMSGVETGRMFGSEGLKISGKVFAMEVKGKLVVKIPAGRANELVAEGSATFFDPGHGRLMKEWVAVRPKSLTQWVTLAEEALVFVKAGKKK